MASVFFGTNATISFRGGDGRQHDLGCVDFTIESDPDTRPVRTPLGLSVEMVLTIDKIEWTPYGRWLLGHTAETPLPRQVWRRFLRQLQAQALRGRRWRAYLEQGGEN